VLDGEVLDEDVEDEVGIISVYLHPKSVEKIGIINERTQTLGRLRSHVAAPFQQILGACVVYSDPTPYTTRQLGSSQFRLTLHLVDCDP